MNAINKDRLEELENIRKLPMNQWAENGYNEAEFQELSKEYDNVL